MIEIKYPQEIAVSLSPGFRTVAVVCGEEAGRVELFYHSVASVVLFIMNSNPNTESLVEVQIFWHHVT